MQFASGRLGSLPRGPAAGVAGRGQPDARRGSRYRRLMAAGSALAMAVLTVTAVASPASAAATDKVDKQVLNELAEQGTTQFMVYMKEKADLKGAAALTSKTAKSEKVYEALTSTAARSQAGLKSMLTTGKVQFKSYWIANVLVVTGDKKVLDSVASRSEVKNVKAVKNIPLIEPTERVEAATVNAIEWGVANINAPQVWNDFGTRGEGITIANIDTGVDFDHPAVVGKYRGNLGGTFDHNYNWWDPSSVCGSPSLVPCDNNNHGTHTMGTMVGDDGANNQIGVAPGAKWFAAKGCEVNTCTETALLSAGQFVLAPTDLAGANPRPDLNADIVNNSWGDDLHDDWYMQTVDSWIEAGIMPIFSSGNSGPGCNTAGSPGDYPQAYSTGGYDINNNIYVNSSRGNGTGDSVKPNISGPAVNVRSSINGGGYAGFTGTSMAAPHLSATVALMWSAAPGLKGNINATREILDNTARDVDSLGCGGTVDDNNNFGEGRLDAYQAVLQSPRGPNGRVTGTVTDAATGAPLAGATVSGGDIEDITGADGVYQLTLPVGDHTVTASKFGYATETATVTVTEGSVITQNFALDAQASVTVSGRVLDGSGHGWGLYAKLEVAGSPGGPIFTNPATGAFSFTVPAGATYSVTATPLYPGYLAETVEVVVGDGAVTQDITLEVNAVTCNAPGYRVNLSDPVLSEEFSSGSLPAGWEVVNNGAGGWAFNDPGGQGNLTGGSGGFADADSDAAGSGTTVDTYLVTPTLDLSGVATPSLSFNSDFRDLLVEDFTDVDVSVDGGATWTNAYHQEASLRGPRLEEVALGAAANQSNVKLRFHYFGTFDWWWQVDNVRVVNRSCDPVTGGLVVGFTTDSLAGAPLNGVTVTSDDQPADKGVSAATPDDPNIPDGFYWLFSGLTGAHPFTASKSPYQSVTQTVTVAANSTVQADFALAASRLTVAPTKIESYQTLGQTRNYNITVRNTGNAPAQVDLFERGGGFELLAAKRGAPLQNIAVPGGVSKAKYGAEKNVRGLTKPQSEPWVVDAWAPIDDAPSATADNAAAWLDGKVYTVGGRDAADLTKAMVYDPAAEAWTTLPVLPTGREKPQAAAVGGKLYVFGGWASSGTPVATVDVFDPAAGSWSTLAATNSQARAAAGTAVVDGKVYLVGGCVDGNCTTSDKTISFDPDAETFAEVAAYPHPVSWMGCGGISGRAYCAGGIDAESFTDGYSYDPASDSWSPIATMPVDLWASQEAAASGLLVFAGGVANGSSAITNQTVAYDPASDSWQELPNANVATYRGAGACGVYKIGGLEPGNVATAASEWMAGLDQCADAADLPWLSADPASFTLAPGASRTVKVTLSATTDAGVLQPGDYTGEIAVRSNSPYAVNSVDVTMHVLPPASWGKVSGTVTGAGCGGDVPLPAQLEITLSNNPDVSYALKAGGDGTYAIWLPKGRYDIIASRDGWRAQSKRHQVKAGFVESLDFSLRPFVACPTRAGGV
jgi:subtilisin family serine protease